MCANTRSKNSLSQWLDKHTKPGAFLYVEAGHYRALLLLAAIWSICTYFLPTANAKLLSHSLLGIFCCLSVFWASYQLKHYKRRELTGYIAAWATGIFMDIGLLTQAFFETDINQWTVFWTLASAIAAAICTVQITAHLEPNRQAPKFLVDIFILVACFVGPVLIYTIFSIAPNEAAATTATVMSIAGVLLCLHVTGVVILGFVLYPKLIAPLLFPVTTGLFVSIFHLGVFTSVLLPADQHPSWLIWHRPMLDIGSVAGLWFIFRREPLSNAPPIYQSARLRRTLSWFAAVAPIAIPIQTLWLFPSTWQDPDRFNVLLLVLIVTGLATFVRTGVALASEGKIQRELIRITEIDPQTGAMNRRGFFNHYYTHACAGDFLVLIDINNFKLLNDTYGHATGDRVLKQIHQQLNAATDIRFHARLGADEFALLVSATAERIDTSIQALSQSLTANVKQNGSIGHFQLALGAVPIGKPNLGDNLVEADNALAVAKRHPSRRYIAREGEQVSPTKRQINLIVQHCIHQQQLPIYVQPIVSLREDKVVAFEALMRLPGSSGSTINPAYFIDTVKSQGMMLELTLLLINKVDQAFSKSLSAQSVTINLPPNLLVDELTFSALLNRLTSIQIPPQQVILELTEDRAFEVARLLEAVQRLSNAGFKIALDDFGVADSSLARASILPIDVVKIDRFVLQDNTHRTQMVLRSSTDLARRLNALVIVEGVETHEQFEALKAYSVDAVQGFWCARPFPPRPAARPRRHDTRSLTRHWTCRPSCPSGA